MVGSTTQVRVTNPNHTFASFPSPQNLNPKQANQIEIQIACARQLPHPLFCGKPRHSPQPCPAYFFFARAASFAAAALRINS